VKELSARPLSGFQLLSSGAGALWAALNATWAMIYGLNRAYEVQERRSPWELAVTIVGLAAALAVSGAISVLLIFFGARLEAQLFPSLLLLRAVEWLVVSATLFLSFAILYRFAPNLKNHKWQWSTPGAICAFVIWVGATVASRLYFDHINDYSRSYGPVNRVVMLLLWLYVTNGAILIGGEMNSEIEKAAEEGVKGADTEHGPDRSGS
jgi:membrane protein